MMRKIVFLLVFLFSISSIFAQDRTITGKVVDETGAGLIGATVQLKGSQKGAVTDVNGGYSLSVPATGATLVISYVGYVTQEIAVGESNLINVNLAQDVQNLEQVVVVGYGVQKKSLVTGSISKVDSKDISSSPVARIDQALQGKTSGVYIAQNSGSPGGAMAVRIRGQSSDGKNDPIYIVNGVKTGSIDFLSPSDIESIEILKDAASCAIYGAEGGNGVVIISTKKGKAGVSEINYNYYHGWQSAAHLVTPMNAQQYITYNKESYSNDGTPVPAKYDVMAASGINTNWVDQIFQEAPVNEHNISFNSGTEKGSFLLSASYFDQDGIVGGPKSNYTRYSFLFNGESNLKSWLTIGANVNYSLSKKKNLQESNDAAGGIINSAIYYDPTAPIFYEKASDIPWSDPAILSSLTKDANGRVYFNSPEVARDASNPLSLMANTFNTTQTDKILGDIHADIKFFEGLKFSTKLALDYSLVVDDIFNPKYYYDDSNFQTNDTLVSVTSKYTRNYKYAFENFISYNKTFGDHTIEAMFGMSYENYAPTFISATGLHIPYGSKDFAYLSNSRGYPTRANTVAGGVGTGTDDYSYDKGELQNSYFGRFIYNYKERYMVQGNFRRDGSSLFGPNNRYATFPSFSLGWNVSREDFFKDNVSFINTLKLRYSWGQNGNKQILKPFMYLTQMSSPFASYDDGGANFQYGKLPKYPANYSLKWETSQQSDFGLELGILKNRITFSADRYVKSTIDQLADKTDATLYMGFKTPPVENRGEITNKGWEFDITYREVEKEFKYSASLNASYVKNEVVSYGSKATTFKNGYKFNTGDYITVYQPGYPVWYFKGLKAIGIFQSQDEVNAYVGPDGVTPIQKDAQPGDIKFADIASKDANNNIVMVPDGKIDDNDKTMIGKPQPDWTFGFNFTCEYKGVDLGLSFQGVTGNQIFNAAIQTTHSTYNKPDYYFTERWTGPGTSNKYPRASNKSAKNLLTSSLYISDGDYLRLKNLSLGYTLPKNVTSKVGISKLRFYVSGTNLLTFTKYKGTDPEIGQLDNNNNAFGVDRGIYPQSKVYTVGLNLSF